MTPFQYSIVRFLLLFILPVFFPFLQVSIAYGQEPCNIFNETFDYPDGTVSGSLANGSWTSSFGNCTTVRGPLVTPDYWGTFEGIFLNHAYGGNCCQGKTEGDGQNFLDFTIDISEYSDVSFSVEIGTPSNVLTLDPDPNGPLECRFPSGPFFGCDAEDYQLEEHDQIAIYYGVDGASVPETLLAYACGDNGFGTYSESGLNGSTLRIRIYTRNVGLDDYHTIDDVCVTGSGTVLPVELIRFDAQARDRQIELFWETAWEDGNDFFSIERSGNGYDYSPIGQISGAGTTSTGRFYQFVDHKPLSGTNYYQLRQVDFDGTSVISRVVQAYMNRSEAALSIFPNPTNDKLHFTLQGNNTEPQSILIQDTFGRIVTKYNAGSSMVKELDISRLPTGTYVLVIASGRHLYQARFQKM